MKILKFILLIVTIIVIIGLIAYLAPVMKNLSTHEGQIAFKEKIQDSGIYGFLTLFRSTNCPNIFNNITW